MGCTSIRPKNKALVLALALVRHCGNLMNESTSSLGRACGFKLGELAISHNEEPCGKKKARKYDMVLTHDMPDGRGPRNRIQRHLEHNHKGLATLLAILGITSYLYPESS